MVGNCYFSFGASTEEKLRDSRGDFNPPTSSTIRLARAALSVASRFDFRVCYATVPSQQGGSSYKKSAEVGVLQLDGSAKWEVAWIILVGVLVLLGLGYGVLQT